MVLASLLSGLFIPCFDAAWADEFSAELREFPVESLFYGGPKGLIFPDIAAGTGNNSECPFAANLPARQALGRISRRELPCSPSLSELDRS